MDKWIDIDDGKMDTLDKWIDIYDRIDRIDR